MGEDTLWHSSGRIRATMWKAGILLIDLLFTIALVQADGSRSNRSYGTRRLDPETLCANSSDATECRRRVEVCRNMHRGRQHRERMREIFVNCAAQLNITNLPDFSDETNHQQAFRTWMRENPEDKRRLFNCAHQGLYNEDGTMNRPAMLEKVRTLLEGQDEPALLQELTNKINNCPESTRREFFTCVFMGCATPQ